MQDHELTAWLGPVEATDEQIEALHRASGAVDTRYTDADHGEARNAAFSAAAQIILGDDTLESIAQEYLQARARERATRYRLTGALIAHAGDSEVQLAGRAGVTRMTVRKALGK